MYVRGCARGKVGDGEAGRVSSRGKEGRRMLCFWEEGYSILAALDRDGCPFFGQMIRAEERRTGGWGGARLGGLLLVGVLEVEGGREGWRGRASASWVGATTLENEGGKGVPFVM